MPNIRETVAANLSAVQQRIEAACQRSGRPSVDVSLIAVTKYAQPEWVQALVTEGQTRLGESRPQQLAARAAEMSPDIEWHLIGHLQRNKVDLILPVTHLIHSADSLRLLKRISGRAVHFDRIVRVLIEVNVSGEVSKDGFPISDLRESWPEIRELPGLEIRGLMTMAPLSEDLEGPRPVFQSLRELKDELTSSASEAHALTELSMGMSRDFEVAIEEGATLVRVGSSLFKGLAEPANRI